METTYYKTDDGKHFAVGDRVVARRDRPRNNPTLKSGSEGVILKINPDEELPIGVYWDELIEGGHRLYTSESPDVLCPTGHGWWVKGSDIDVIVEADEELEAEDLEVFAAFLGV